MALDIIRAKPSDAAAVAPLGRITFAETFGDLFSDHRDDRRSYLDATFDVAKIERSLGKPENLYWLAQRNELPVGYAKLKYPSAPPGKPGRDAAQLQKIYVLRKFHGDGIGRALMASIRQASHLASLIWLAVLSQNERAILASRRSATTRTRSVRSASFST
jgi:diamine N-acetyltransferase